MFYEYNKIHTMVVGAYKKLKSHYYYDKTLMDIKYKIAMFESDYEKFKLDIDKLTINILNENTEYFDDLINKIDFIVLPKKLIHEVESTDIVKSNVENKKSINKINFFIDAPVELLIIDLIWLLLVGKINIDNFGYPLHTYAGLFKQSVFQTDDPDLFSGIDFYSNRCFMPYFNLYSIWRDKAFDTVKEKQTNTDILMLSLDLKSFYYSVEFNFDSLQTLLNKDKRLLEIEFITKVIEKIYIKYTNIIFKYKKGIRKKNKTCIFPIGLLSPVVLRELYLKNLDKAIDCEIQPYYYGRYVDDILLVFNGNGMDKLSKKRDCRENID